jgi:hypothetical protein
MNNWAIWITAIAYFIAGFWVGTLVTRALLSHKLRGVIRQLDEINTITEVMLKMIDAENKKLKHLKKKKAK